jgi:hypothetical protein
MSDTDDVYRVYRPEWLIVDVTTRLGDDPSDEAMIATARAVFDTKFAGRVHDHDVRYTTVGTGQHAQVLLELRLPNLTAEWKTRALAEKYVAGRGWSDATIVARNSKPDFDLRGYSVKKLPDPC